MWLPLSERSFHVRCDNSSRQIVVRGSEAECGFSAVANTSMQLQSLVRTVHATDRAAELLKRQCAVTITQQSASTLTLQVSAVPHNEQLPVLPADQVTRYFPLPVSLQRATIEISRAPLCVRVKTEPLRLPLHTADWCEKTEVMPTDPFSMQCIEREPQRRLLTDAAHANNTADVTLFSNVLFSPWLPWLPLPLSSCPAIADPVAESDWLYALAGIQLAFRPEHAAIHSSHDAPSFISLKSSLYMLLSSANKLGCVARTQFGDHRCKHS